MPANRDADAVFRFLTRLGEGWALARRLVLCVVPFALCGRFLGSAWLNVLVIQFLKHVFFGYMRRPAAVFEGSELIHFVEGVTYGSATVSPRAIRAIFFPSVLRSLLPRCPFGWVFFVPAVLVAYSRVFLSQHFMQDILAGSFVAVCCTSVCLGFGTKNQKNSIYLQG